jgi:hypothetical protein
LARENQWGYTRILGELRKLGIQAISRNTVKRILKDAGFDPNPRRGEQTWDEFLKRHTASLWQADFFSKRIVTLEGIRQGLAAHRRSLPATARQVAQKLRPTRGLSSTTGRSIATKRRYYRCARHAKAPCFASATNRPSAPHSERYFRLPFADSPSTSVGFNQNHPPLFAAPDVFSTAMPWHFQACWYHFKDTTVIHIFLQDRH